MTPRIQYRFRSQVRRIVFLSFFLLFVSFAYSQKWSELRTLKVINSIYSGYYNNTGYIDYRWEGARTSTRLHYFLNCDGSATDSANHKNYFKGLGLYDLSRAVFHQPDTLLDVFMNVNVLDSIGRFILCSEAEAVFSNPRDTPLLYPPPTQLQALPFDVVSSTYYGLSQVMEVIYLRPVAGLTPTILDKDYFVLIAALLQSKHFVPKHLPLMIHYIDKKKDKQIFFPLDFDFEPYLKRFSE